MSKVHKFGQLMLTVVVASSVLSGCSYVVKSGANVALQFSEKYIVPPILSGGDADMACSTGNALTPAILATKDMGADPTRMAVLLYSAAGMCAENRALDAELRYLRASKDGKVTEAQDARVEQKRWAALAASRQYAGYQLFAERWQAKYKYTLGDSCPAMRKDLDQTVYLIGMLSGLQAMTNDINSGGAVNVPKDIAAIASLKASAVSGTLALPPGPLGMLTIIPDLIAVWKIQAQMVVDMAAAYGKTADLNREVMLYCLFKQAASQVVRDLVVRTGERFLIKRTSLRTIQTILQKIGVKVTQRVAGKGIARWLPIIGAMGVAAYAYYDTDSVAKSAIELFNGDITIDKTEVETD